jgi:hypothetical protein
MRRLAARQKNRDCELGGGADPKSLPPVADADATTPEHVSEAIQHRPFDRTLWV